MRRIACWNDINGLFCNLQESKEASLDGHDDQDASVLRGDDSDLPPPPPEDDITGDLLDDEEIENILEGELSEAEDER